MKITFETTATLDEIDLFTIIKKYIENKTNKKLAYINWDETVSGEVVANLNFCVECVDLLESETTS